MATKIERTVVVPDTIYTKIYRIAEREKNNIPFVTRQLLVKALAEEKTPDWFFQMQGQITALRNELLSAQRAREQQERTAEQLLIDLQKQIAELKESLNVSRKGEELESDDLKAHEMLLCPEIQAQFAQEIEPVQAVASINPPEKVKILRPFFGRLSQMFGVVLN